MTQGGNWRKRRKALRWSQQELADAAELSKDTIRRAERNAEVSPSTVEDIEAALSREEATRDPTRHTRASQLPHAEVEEYDRDMSRGYKKHDVPLIGDAEASTNGVIAWNEEGLVRAQIEKWVSRSFADGDPKAYALRVRGDSMVPRYFPGEIVVAQPRLNCRDGDYAVVILKSEERLVKRVLKTQAGWTLHSENPLYPDRAVSDDEVLAMHRIKHSMQAN